jgi:P4 family phage/plasmid primase-like protien
MSPETPNIVEAALRYRQRGTKEPLLAGWTDLRASPEDIPGLFAGDVGVGLSLGEPSGWLVDVDLDCEEARRLAPEFLPPTQAKTGRPGSPDSHWWYIAADAKTKRFRDERAGGMIVELRSTGCQTVVGPSTHPSGEPYSNLDGEPAVVDAEDLRAAVERLRDAVYFERHGPLEDPPPPPPRKTKASGPDRAWRETGPILTADDVSLPMQRRIERCRQYINKCPEAKSGAGGHNATLRAACECFRFGLDRASARSVMDWFNGVKTAGEPWTDKEIEHKLNDAETKVREDNEFGIRLIGYVARGGRSLEETAQLHTDVGNAARFVLGHGNRFRYSYQRNAWLVWDGCRWAWDSTGAVLNAAKQTALAILEDSKAVPGTEESDRASQWSRSSQRHQRVTAMIALAQPDVAVISDALDADPYLFNCLNGTIDLRTGRLRDYDPADLITRLAPVEYDPLAKCPRFLRFVERIFGSDQELIGFVRRWHGYSLTGDVRHQFLPIYYGEGNNGKSVLLDTISAVMGDYAGEAPPDLLVVRKHAEHPTQVADLYGRRLVVASETEEGAELALPLIKRLTGNLRVKARFMRQDYFEFTRTHKFVLVTNHKPMVADSTESAWRRLLLVPFSVVIPTHERDPNLMETLRGEYPGILAWLVGGASEDLVIPEAIRLATNEYRGRSNSFEEFLSSECDFQPDSVVLSQDIAVAFRSWAEEQGVAVVQGRAVGAALRERGCVDTKLAGERAWRGLALKNPGHIAHKVDESPVPLSME